MRISMAWWNTSLSPPRAKPGRISKEDSTVFLELLSELITTYTIDIIGFCELSKPDVDWLESICTQYGYLIKSGIIKAGRANFDTCLLYRPEKLELVDSSPLQDIEVGRVTKIGLQYLFNIVGDTRPLHVFTSHWPSRLHLSKWDPKRLTLGKSLRKPIQLLIDDAKIKDEAALIIAMGDYNDEPFDASITEGLLASRDRSLIQKNHQLLYNPFWRRLGGRDEYSHSSKDTNYSGTYYYSSENVDRWRTFDQIIVSSSFIGTSDWHLIESETAIIDYAPYTEKVLNKKSKFDHLPIKITIQKV